MSYWAKQLDSVILRIEDKINQEKASIENLVKLPSKEQVDLDIADLYNEIQNTSDDKIEDEILSEKIVKDTEPEPEL